MSDLYWVLSGSAASCLCGTTVLLSLLNSRLWAFTSSLNCPLFDCVFFGIIFSFCLMVLSPLGLLAGWALGTFHAHANLRFGFSLIKVSLTNTLQQAREVKPMTNPRGPETVKPHLTYFSADISLQEIIIMRKKYRCLNLVCKHPKNVKFTWGFTVFLFVGLHQPVCVFLDWLGCSQSPKMPPKQKKTWHIKKPPFYSEFTTKKSNIHQILKLTPSFLQVQTLKHKCHG